MSDLIGGGLEQDAQDRLQPSQRPLVAERRGDGLVEPLAVLNDAADDLAKQSGVGLAVDFAVDLAAEAVSDEFADHPLGAEPGVQLKLIQRLDRGEPR
jgi:hypothetical protein